MLQKVRKIFISLSSEYIAACKHPNTLRRSLRSFGIIRLLINNKYLLDYLDPDSQKKLLSAIESYGNKFVEILKQQKYQIDEIVIFTNSLEQIVDYLKNYDYLQIEKHQLPSSEIVTNLAREFIQYCCALITEEPDNLDIISNLQATAIIVNIDGLSIEQQKLLLNKLLSIRELWLIDATTELKEESIILLFHNNILSILKEEKLDDTKLENCHSIIFERIIVFLLDDHNILMELTNNKLISLYNRLQNLCTNSQAINHILIKIHDESKFRNNYNKLKNSGYDLLKLFENYTIIIYQIENSEFVIVEKFLLNKKGFMHEILINITRHIDFIRMLNIREHHDLNYILDHIRIELTKNFQSGHTIALMISSIESKFSSDLEDNIINRYFSLDNFTKNALRTRYQSLFRNIISLLEKDQNYTKFVQQAIISKIASDYKINIKIASAKMLRSIEAERLEVIKKLSEINFVEIFRGQYLNKTTSLNFRKYMRTITITTPLGFVIIIIKLLLTNFTTEQFKVLLPWVINGNKTTMQRSVRHELVTQVKKRTTISKMIYYLLTGRKKELDNLNFIKKSLSKYL
jgi:hypothetical protein